VLFAVDTGGGMTQWRLVESEAHGEGSAATRLVFLGHEQVPSPPNVALKRRLVDDTLDDHGNASAALTCQAGQDVASAFADVQDIAIPPGQTNRCVVLVHGELVQLDRTSSLAKTIAPAWIHTPAFKQGHSAICSVSFHPRHSSLVLALSASQEIMLFDVNLGGVLWRSPSFSTPRPQRDDTTQADSGAIQWSDEHPAGFCVLWGQRLDVWQLQQDQTRPVGSIDLRSLCEDQDMAHLAHRRSILTLIGSAGLVGLSHAILQIDLRRFLADGREQQPQWLYRLLA